MKVCLMMLFKTSLTRFARRKKKECTESASIDWVDPFDFSAGHYGIDKESILNCDQPKIEDFYGK